MKIDATKSAIQNVIDLINAGNTGLNLTAAQVTFGAPVDKTDSGDGRNSTVTATAVANQGFTGSVDVNYVRRPLNDSVLNPVFSTNVDDGVDKATIISSIAPALGLVASELDLTGDITRPGSGDTSTVTLTVKAGSLLYLAAATQDITLNWAHHDTSLATAVATTDLPGFDAAS